MVQITGKEELREHITCSMCKNTFTNPRELACFHVFCETCLKTLTPAKTENKQGFHCPTCKTFCRLGDEKTPYMRNEFVKVFTSVERKCGTCGKDGAVWHCQECDNIMCDDCKMHHSKMLLTKGHAVLSSEEVEGQQFVINKPIVCEVHADKLVEYYCSVCQELICSNCLAEKHKLHEIGKLMDAAESFKPVITKKIDLIEGKNKIHDDQVSSAESQMNEVREVFDGVKDELRQTRQIVMQKINAQYDRDVNLLEECKNLEIKKLAELKEKNEYDIMENNQLLTFTKVTLQNAKSGSLVKELTQGLSRRIDDAISKKPLDNSKKNKLPRLEKNALILAENILGKIHWDDDAKSVKIKNNTFREKRSFSLLAITSIVSVIILIIAMCLMHVPLAVPVAHTTYATSEIEKPKANLVTDRQDTETPDISFIKIQKSEFISDLRHVDQNISEVLDRLSPAGTDIYTLPTSARRMALVNDTIWIPLTYNHSIAVITLNGTEMNRIHLSAFEDAFLYPICVLQVNKSELLLASDKGLYVLDSTGKKQYRVAEGNFHDISKQDDKVIALQKNVQWIIIDKGITLQSLKYDSGKWISDKRTITINNSFGLDRVTMAVYDEFVYISSSSYHLIYKYTLGGVLLQTYHGWGLAVGKLSFPYLSAVDPWGTVLICDWGNDRLQTLSAEGEWREYRPEGGVWWPEDAIIVNKSLYVLWWDYGTQRISQYTIGD